MPCLCRCLAQLRVSQLALVVKNLPANAGDLRHRFDCWAGKIPGRRAWQPTPVSLPRESRGQRRMVGCSHGVSKSRTRLKRLSMLSLDVAQGHLLLCCGCTRLNARLWHGE